MPFLGDLLLQTDVQLSTQGPPFARPGPWPETGQRTANLYLHPQNRIQQPRKPLVHLLAAQRVHVLHPGDAGVYQARRAQDAEMVGHARFRAAAVERGAAGFARAVELADDVEPDRIAQRVQRVLDGDVGKIGMRIIPHAHPYSRPGL